MFGTLLLYAEVSESASAAQLSSWGRCGKSEALGGKKHILLDLNPNENSVALFFFKAPGPIEVLFAGVTGRLNLE